METLFGRPWAYLLEFTLSHAPDSPRVPSVTEQQTPSAHSDDELVREHLPLVGHLVRETMSRVPAHVNRDDLTSAGLVALVQAARSFDAGRGVSFSRYASTRVRGAILDELRSVDWASRSVRRRARQVDEVRNSLAAQLGRLPSVGEIAASLGVGAEEIAANEEDVSRAVVMSLQGFGETPIDDMLASHIPGPEAVVEHRERVGYLQDAVAQLPERLRTVIEGCFYDERPMAEIAEKLGVTESRVSQMRAEALALLKDAVNAALEPAMVTPHARPHGCAARRRDAYFAAVAAHRSFATRLAPTAYERLEIA
jgi:RNA polymerase sigma factor for flagellar operon FliA